MTLEKLDDRRVTPRRGGAAAAPTTRLGAWMLAGVLASLLGACARTDLAPAPPSVIERLEVRERAPAYGGATFGAAGAYEKVTAVAHVRVDPQHPANRAIVDLGAAAGADGAVRYRTDVVLLRPRDAARASGVLVFEAANRGRPLMLQLVNEGALQTDTAAQAGTGWLMRQGHALLWVGWQGDVALAADGRSVGMALPVATQGGTPITGTSLEETVFDVAGTNGTLALSYPTATPDPARAELSVRARPGAAPTVLPDTAWRYTKDNQISFERPAAFDAGAVYRFRYEARDPRPFGLGMAAVRDVVSFLKRSAPDAAGQPHALADIRTRTTVALGISQSGRFLRDFLWQGFNAEPGRGAVFDGVMPTIAGSRKTFTNVRWAQPGRYSRQHEEHDVYGDQFPFGYATTTDPLTGRSDGIFARCRADATCPKLMHLDSSLEFWQARSALVVTDGAGRDVPLPDDVRAYLMASTQHVTSATPASGICKAPNNPARQASTYRVLMARLISWARDGEAPPPSRFPSVAAGTLVAPEPGAMGFPDLAALRVPAELNTLQPRDHSTMPPRTDATKRYNVLVPRTDADGHDLAGIRTPDIDAPLATHTGFNVRRAGFAEGQLCGLNGAYLPFARDPGERRANADPRPSITERYPTRSAYLQRVRGVAEALKSEGLLLDEDVTRYVDSAAREPRVQTLAP